MEWPGCGAGLASPPWSGACGGSSLDLTDLLLGPTTPVAESSEAAVWLSAASPPTMSLPWAALGSASIFTAGPSFAPVGLPLLGAQPPSVTIVPSVPQQYTADLLGLAAAAAAVSTPPVAVSLNIGAPTAPPASSQPPPPPPRPSTMRPKRGSRVGSTHYTGPARAFRRTIAPANEHWLYAVEVDIDGCGDGGEWRLRGSLDIPLQHLTALMCHDQVDVVHSGAPVPTDAAAGQPPLMCCGMGWVCSADGSVRHCENVPDGRIAARNEVRACRDCRAGMRHVIRHVCALVCDGDGVFVYSRAAMQRAIDYVVEAACVYNFTNREHLYPVHRSPAASGRARHIAAAAAAAASAGAPVDVSFVHAVAGLRVGERIDVDASLATVAPGSSAVPRWVVVPAAPAAASAPAALP